MGKNDRKGKGTREDTKGFVSSDDFSDDERVVLEDHDESRTSLNSSFRRFW